jgi:Rrf2 family protein
MAKLFNISEASNIAVHSLALIAASKEPLNTAVISDMLNLSRNHISKVLQTLAKQNVLTSGRGPRGGFQLSKSPEEISIFEICEMMDGKYEPEHCRRHSGDCPFAECVYGGERQKLYDAFKDYYSKRKLSDLEIEKTDEKKYHKD